MGIIRRQSFWNTAISYTGILLGFANKALLYTAIFAQEYYGLLGVIAAAALVVNTAAQLGVGTIAIRFMPYVKEQPERWRRFNGMLLTYIIAGVSLVTVIMLLAKPAILGFYSEKSSLFGEYYNYAIFLFFGLAFSQFSTYVCFAHLKTVLPAFMRDVGIKLWQTLLGLGFWLSLYDFDLFLKLYVAGWALWAIIQMGYLILTGRFPVKIDLTFFKTRLGRLSVNYGLFTSLSQASGTLVNHLDKLMVPALAATGLIAGANYELGFFMATVIIMPYRAIVPISFGVIARSFREGDMGNIEMVYKKSSLNGLLVGLAAFFLIFINLDSFFILRPEFEEARWVFFFLGLAYLFDIANGINSQIMVVSKYYRIDLWIHLSLLVIALATNYWLIPIFGEVGAALATAGSVLLYNLIRGLFLWNKFSIQPFSWKTLQLLGIAVAALLVGMFIPIPSFFQEYNPYIQAVAEVVLRSIPSAIIYGVLLFGLRISPDLNQMLEVILAKVRGSGPKGK